MKPLGWVFLPLAMGSLLVSAEALYRRRVHSQLQETRRTLLAGHPHWKNFEPELRRFGRDVVRCEPSLAGDLLAWITLEIGNRSELGGRGAVSAYHLVAFDSWPEADKECHVFLWSPRQLRFVPWETASWCHGGTCPWAPPPPSAIRRNP